MGARKHDDAHRPLGGTGQRGNRTTGRPANWGGGELLEAPLCAKCGVMMGRYFSAWRCNGCGKQETPNVVAAPAVSPAGR